MKNNYKKGAAPVIIIIIILALAVGGFYFYSSSKSQVEKEDNQVEEGQAGQEPTAQVSGRASIGINNFLFGQNIIAVKKGDSVVWTNNDSAMHTVTSDIGLFSSGDISQGQTFSYTFNQTGTFSYHCAYHPNMKAVVIVTD